MTYDPKLRLVKRHVGITMRFPSADEPATKYSEENRWSLINARQREEGWLPTDAPGWWIFPVTPLGVKLAQENHEYWSKVREFTIIVRQPDGTEKKLRME